MFEFYELLIEHLYHVEGIVVIYISAMSQSVFQFFMALFSLQSRVTPFLGWESISILNEHSCTVVDTEASNVIDWLRSPLKDHAVNYQQLACSVLDCFLRMGIASSITPFAIIVSFLSPQIELPIYTLGSLIFVSSQFGVPPLYVALQLSMVNPNLGIVSESSSYQHYKWCFFLLAFLDANGGWTCNLSFSELSASRSRQILLGVSESYNLFHNLIIFNCDLIIS